MAIDRYQELDNEFNLQDDGYFEEKSKKRCCCGWLSRKQCAAVTAISCLLSIGVLVLVVWLSMPQVAQMMLNHSKLQINSMTIGEVSSDGKSFISTVDATLADAGIFSATVDSTILKVYYSGNMIGSVELPKTEITGGQDARIVSSAPFKIENSDAFTSFSSDMIRNDHVVWHLEADCKLTAHVGGMNMEFAGLKLSKDVRLPGLSGLKELEILSADPTASDKNHINVAVAARLENPSILEINPMGDLLFDIRYKNKVLGSMVSLNATMVKGSNYLNMTGTMDSSAMGPEMTEVLSTMMSGKTMTLEAVGAQHNASSVPLFAPSLAGLVLEAAMHIPFKPLITKVDLPHIKMVMDAYNQQTVQMSFEARSTIMNPLGEKCPVNIKEVSMDAQLFTLDKPVKPHITPDGDIEPLDGGHFMGTTVTPTVPVRDGDKTTFSFNITTSVFLNDTDAFGSFGELFVTSASTAMGMQGGSSVTMAAADFPSLTVEGLPFQNVVEIGALDNLKDVTLDIVSVALTGGTKDGLQSVGQLKIENPSTVSLDLGANSSMRLEVYFKDTLVGYSIMDHFIFAEGSNFPSAPMILTLPGNNKMMQGLLADFMCGRDNDVVVAAASSVYPFMDRMLKHMVLPTVLHGQKEKLVPGADMYASLSKFISDGVVPTKLRTYNPFDTVMYIVGYDSEVSKDGVKVGHAKDDFMGKEDLYIKLLPKSYDSTRKIDITVVLGWEQLKEMFAAVVGPVDMDLVADFHVLIGDLSNPYETYVHYEQSDLEAELHFFS